MTVAIWVCPKMCGCKIQMLAEWAQPPINENGEIVSYQHPKAETLSDLQITNVCNEHNPVLSQPIENDPYHGRPGYINPIPSDPTDAEKLYIYLYRYTGNTHSFDTCKCIGTFWFDRHSEQRLPNYFKHPKHFNKCSEHAGLSDDVLLDHVVKENQTKNRALAALLEKVPRLKKQKTNEDGTVVESLDPSVLWSFSGKDDKRQLQIVVPIQPLSKSEENTLKDMLATLNKPVNIL